MSTRGAVAWFRFRATLARRAAGLATLAILVGLVGALAMGAIAGARRTQSSYPVFLRSTDPTDLELPTGILAPQLGLTQYEPQVIAQLAHLPQVKRVASYVQLLNAPMAVDGTPFTPPRDGPQINIGNQASVDGLLIDVDRVTVLHGRMVDRTKDDEMVVSARLAGLMHAHVGSVVSMGFYTNAQEAQPGASGSEARPSPHRVIAMHVVGIGVYNNAIVQDDVDTVGSDFFLLTPALARELTACCAQDTWTGLQLVHGARDVPAVEHEIAELHGGLLAHNFSTPASVEAATERAVKPDSIALGAFGVIAALAGLLIGAQVIGRLLRFGDPDLATLRSIGADRRTLRGDGLPGVLLAILGGAILAVVGAVLLSPIAPIGPVRRVYPARGVAFDWTVLGVGAVIFVVALSAYAYLVAARRANHTVRGTQSTARPSRKPPVAVSSTLPVPAATGVRFALERGRGADAPPVRAAIVGTALAIVVITSTIIFGSSLQTLVARPRLYGWNWDYELSGGGGVGAVPAHLVATALAHDPDVAGSAGVYFTVLDIDGQSVAALAGTPDAAVQPPLLSGHGFDARDEVVLGAETLSELHKRVGDSVSVSTGRGSATKLRIVGTATMPAVGGGGALHPTMGSGALLWAGLIPENLRNAQNNVPAGPNVVFVRFRSGVDVVAARRRLERIATKLSLPTNYGVTVVSVQRPAEIVNYRSMSNTPLLLGSALALGAIVALGLTLVASVRRRRHDLALLKTLGFTRRQLAAVIAVQASVAVAVGTLIGLPVGIAVGRLLWDLFAQEIHAVPFPSVPVALVGLVALGALAVANAVAALPGRQAARTPTAFLLREE